MSGKGSGRRAGANDKAYAENYERTFGRYRWAERTLTDKELATIRRMDDDYEAYLNAEIDKRDTPTRSEE